MSLVRLVLAATVSSLLVYGAAHADPYTCTGSSCSPLLRFTEASTYVSGVPLGSIAGDGLKESEVSWSVDGGTAIKFLIPASSPAGGTVISNSTSIVATIPPCTSHTLTATVIQRTLLGAVSTPSPVATLVMDRTKLPGTTTPDPTCTTPSAPTGVTVQ